MKTFKKKFVLLALIIATVIITNSCSKNEEGRMFTVKGNVENAAGRDIGLYSFSTEGIKQLASTKLTTKGNFEFRAASPTEGFDFYMIGIDSCGAAVFAADSAETIIFKANTKEFTDYTIGGNKENMHIKEINNLRDALEAQVSAMANSSSPAVMKTEREIRTLIDEFKENIIKQYIIPDPGSISAYYALSLTLAGAPLFNPMASRADSRIYAAVATNFQQKNPTSRHAKQIANIAKESIKATREPKGVEIELEESEANIATLFEIKLPSPQGDSIALSSLKGNVILLDFTIYEDANLGGRNIELRELYNKHNKRGFEIYQISLDRREHFWQQSAGNLPWTCVRDAYGTAASLYNVQILPTYFLIDRSGNIVLRNIQIADVNKEIEKLLR